MPRDMLLELLRNAAPPLVSLVPVDNKAQCVDGIAIEQHIHLHQIRAAVFLDLIIERSVATGAGFECVKEIIDNFI